MNDTNKVPKILSIFSKGETLGSSEVAARSVENQSLVTVKRQLKTLTDMGYLQQHGAGRSVKYLLTKKGWLLKPFNMDEYLSQSPDERLTDHHFQFDTFEPPYVELFTPRELQELDQATSVFKKNAVHSDITVRDKELLRFIIEFSWKTSRIEGNTYDLISTERLLRYGEKSDKNTEFEAQMIINQKNALEFILENEEVWSTPNIATLEKLHSFVAENLGISRNLRKTLVGITGTNYRPLENEFQIKDVLGMLFAWVAEAHSTYEKALICVLGLSYIQPFIDGNKRTSRLLSNAILLSNNYAPLSYRSVDEREYKEACLVFYEQNSIQPFKKLFIEQYIFAANNYNIAQSEQ